MRQVTTNIAIFVPHSGCPQQCSFCDQRVISGAQMPPTVAEVKQTCKTALEYGKKQLEIAFFGGSFTAIERGFMVELLESVQEFLQVDRIVGIRISTRPDAIDEEVLAVLKKYGVTSIELGAQSMDNDVLGLNKRGHTADDVRKAATLIKEWGFSLGLQMMTGLYGATQHSDYQTAQELVALAPDTMRVYPTVVLENTELADLCKSGEYSPPNVEETLPLCAKIIRLIRDNNIELIRLGLHASTDMEAKIVAGCYHQAFGELCKSAIYLDEIVKKLQNYGTNRFLIQICHRRASQILGQKRGNLTKLHSLGYDIEYKILRDMDEDYIITERG